MHSVTFPGDDDDDEEEEEVVFTRENRGGSAQFAIQGKGHFPFVLARLKL